MDDTEHDAWLREALRHAPDSGAAPPSVVSAAILAEARAAAARPTAGRAVRRGGPAANPLLALWDWLARPPVAASFATIMVATLVGLMWWDRPMDETLSRAPAPALERSEVPRAAAPVPAAPTPFDSAGAAPPSHSIEPTAPPAAPARAAATRAAKVADAANGSRAKDVTAKEPAEPRKNDPPAAFSSSPPGRERADRAAARAQAEDTKKEASAMPAPAAAPAPFAAPQRALPPAPPPVAAPPVAAAPGPAQSGRLDGDEARNAVSSRADVAATAKRIAPGLGVAEARPGEADALAPSGAAAQNESSARLRRDGGATSAAPLAPLLAAMAGDGARASRQTASGASIALEPAWRDWLIDLGAASAGRWRRTFDSRGQARADVEQQVAAALRLGVDGRPAAIVRIDGTTVHLETLGAAPERWQATLAAAEAERLRAALPRLPP